MKTLDIAIAGAGVGGLAAALALHQLGHRVTVYEQFRAAKPVGSGLIMQPTGLSVLDDWGLGDRLRKLGARIDKLQGTSAQSGKTVLDVRYEALGPDRGYAVHRAALFNVLFDAVSGAGIPIETGSQIVGVSSGILEMRSGAKSPQFDVVVDALGARSPLRQFTVGKVTERPLAYGAVWASLPWPAQGFDPHALLQRYHRASVMLGVLPIGRIEESGPPQAAFFWSLKVADYPAWKQRGLAAWKDDVQRYWPETSSLLNHIESTDELTLANYQHHTLKQPWGDRLISIGDSAHATSPQLGQGANNALLDVRALVLAFKAHRDLTDVAQDYARRRETHVAVYQAMSRVFTPFYQSDSVVLPWLRDVVVSNLARFAPAQWLLARMVAGSIYPPLVSGIASTGTDGSTGAAGGD